MSSVGLDIGPEAIRLLAVEAAGGELRVTAARELPCDTDNPDALTQALIQLRNAAGISRPVVLGLPSVATILTTVSPLLVHAGRAELAVAFELQQQLPFALADTAWHYRWLRPTGAAGDGASTGPREAVAVAVRRSLLEERLAACRRAGISVAAVLPSSVAVHGAWRQRSTGRGPAVIVRAIKDGAAEWIVATDTRWEVVTIAEAEPKGRSQEFAAQIAASWEALRNQFPDMPSAVWLLAPSAEAAAWRDALAARGAGPVEPFDPLRSVKMPSGARIDAPERWAAAVGLVLQASGQAGAPVNLLSHEQQRRHEQQARRAASWFSLGCLALALLFAAQGMLEAYRRQAGVLRALEKQEQAYQALRPEVRAMLQHQQEAEQRTDRLQRLAQGTAGVPQLLAVTAQALPPRVWLTKIDVSRGDRAEALVEGRARSFQELTEFMERVKAAPGVAAVKPLSTEVIPDPEAGKEAVAFSIQVQMAAVPPPAPAPSEAPTEKPGNGKTKARRR